MRFSKTINIYKDFGLILSFYSYYPLFDIKWTYRYNKLWDIRITVLKLDITIYFQGDDMPF